MYNKLVRHFFGNFFFLYVKISTGYYQKKKGRLQKARERCHNLPEEGKNQSKNMGMKSIEIFLKEEKKGQYGHEQYRNLPEGEKQG